MSATNNRVEAFSGREYNPSSLGDTESLDAALKADPLSSGRESRWCESRVRRSGDGPMSSRGIHDPAPQSLSNRWADPWEKPREGWQSRERPRQRSGLTNAEAQFSVVTREGDDRERKRESVANGDGRSADPAGKALRRMKARRASASTPA